MQYSDVSGKSGIIQDITFLLGIDINAYTIEDRTRNINERFRQVWHMIFDAYGGWKFMDDNQSDTSTGLPYAEQTLTADQGLYQLPTGALTVDGVQFINTAGSAWQKIYPITQERYFELGGDGRFVNTNGTPIYYILQGDIIRLIPVPNFTLANALRVYFRKEINTFSISDTTATPGFASPFHRMLSIGAALDYANARGLTGKINVLRPWWDRYELDIKSFYSKRFTDKGNKNIAHGPDLVDEYS